MAYINCQNCGQPSADVARICRYCGCALRTDSTQQPAGYTPPRQAGSYTPAHDWAASGNLASYAPPQPLQAENFRCPYCQATAPPVVAKRISTSGWVVFFALLVFCLPLCFVGLFIKEEYRMCSWCRASLS